jgi:nucleoside-diphosphate-sugar epimerase
MIEQTALVLGATGGIGGEVALQMRDAGWNVRALQRNAATKVSKKDGIEWIRGDAMHRADVMAAATNCAVIVHAVNPPGYKRWNELVLPMMENTIAAAQAHGACIVLPGTVYNFGPDAFPLLHEDSPQHPSSKKGQIRVQMEQLLRAASQQGTQVIVVRAGDFFGPRVGNGWFSQGLIKPGVPVRQVSLPGAPGIGHQWSYVPDVARTMIELLQRREELDSFADFHMAGHWDNDGRQMGLAIRRVVMHHGGAEPALRAFPWWAITLASPFMETLREMREMRYLWKTSVRMDNAKLLHTLGHEPHTALDQAIETTLQAIGCLPVSLDQQVARSAQ